MIISDGTIHWHKDESTTTTSTHWKPSRAQANPVDIEMTAYSLLVMAVKGDFSAGMPIMKWITSQRNANGGFSSTQVWLETEKCFTLLTLFIFVYVWNSIYRSIHLQ